MSLNARKTYRFGDFELRVTARVLTRDGKQIPLGSKAFEVLTCLVMRAGEVVPKDELLKIVWPDAFVEEGNLTQQISALRKALGECAGYIVTIAGKGYQFTADVQTETIAQPSPETETKEISVSRVREATNLFIVESSPRSGVWTPNGPGDEEGHKAADAPSRGGNADLSLEMRSESSDSALPPSAESDQERRRSKLRRIVGWPAGAVAVTLLAVGAYILIARQRRPPFEHFTIQQATESEHARMTAISPDGAYLASVITDAHGSESLWIHHLATGSEQPILQNAALHYLDVTFSPDGSFIYFRTPELSDPVHRSDVYRIPILGGPPSRILENVDAQVSFIDAGRRLCFYRVNAPTSYMFLSAAADGGDERTLSTGKLPYPTQAVCAPDGNRAVVEDGAGNIDILDFASGTKRALLSSAKSGAFLNNLCWDQKGDGIFGIRYTKSRLSRQLAFLSYPGGSLREITSDLSEYVGISLTANAKIIAATEMDRNSNFEELTLEYPTRIQEHQIEGLLWFTPLHGDTILTANQHSVFRVVDLTDDHAVTLLAAKEHFFLQPSLCDASTVVVSGQGPDNTRRIYRMQLDGSTATQITAGPLDLMPECTHDGKWLFYWDNRDTANPSLMRVPLKGGMARWVAAGYWFNLSPDGKLLATSRDDSAKHLRVLSSETLQEVHNFPLPADASAWVAFSPDSQSVFYVTQSKLGSETAYHRYVAAKSATIWRQPLNGFAPVEVASISGRFIYWIRALPDRGNLGLTTMTLQYRVILLRDAP